MEKPCPLTQLKILVGYRAHTTQSFSPTMNNIHSVNNADSETFSASELAEIKHPIDWYDFEEITSIRNS